MQLGGIHQVTAITGNASQNVAFYTQVLGLHLVKKTVNQDDVSAYHLFYGDDIAFRTPNDEEHVEWRKRIAQAGSSVTPIIDRYYFHSIYFHEPGGVLFEIATEGPGFTADEDPEHLGERLSRPSFLEPHRQEIEENLKPIRPVKIASAG